MSAVQHDVQLKQRTPAVQHDRFSFLRHTNRLWWLPKVVFQQSVVFGSLLSNLVRTFDLFCKQGVKCLHKIFWRTALNNFSDLLVEIDGFQLV